MKRFISEIECEQERAAELARHRLEDDSPAIVAETVELQAAMPNDVEDPDRWQFE